MLPKSIDLTDFSTSECSDIGLFSEIAKYTIIFRRSGIKAQLNTLDMQMKYK